MIKLNIPKALAIAATAAALVAAVACKKPAAGAGASETASEASPVKVLKAGRQKITEKITYTGTIEAWNKINITPEAGGKIAVIHVQEGVRVAKGQLLAELETESIRLQLKQAQAAVAVAEAAHADALRNKERMDRLIKENAVSEQQREKVQLAYDSAAAQLEQARAGLNLAQHALDISIMRAPFSGVIASKNAEVGDVINPMMAGFGGGAGGVLTLMDYSRVKIEIEVSQEAVIRMSKGQPAIVKIAALAGREFPGTVSLVNLTADPLSRKFRAEITADNPDLVLRPGTFGEVTLEVSSHADALVIPQKAVIGDRYVFVAEDGKAVRREIRLGLQNHTTVEVVSGISEGELVIVEGNYGLEDGSPIVIQD